MVGSIQTEVIQKEAIQIAHTQIVHILVITMAVINHHLHQDLHHETAMATAMGIVSMIIAEETSQNPASRPWCKELALPQVELAMWSVELVKRLPGCLELDMISSTLCLAAGHGTDGTLMRPQKIKALIALVEAKYRKSVQKTAQDTAVSASDVLLVRRTHSLRARRIILSSVRSYTISGMNKDNSFRRRPCSIERPASKMEASLSELG